MLVDHSTPVLLRAGLRVADDDLKKVVGVRMVAADRGMVAAGLGMVVAGRDMVAGRRCMVAGRRHLARHDRRRLWW